MNNKFLTIGLVIVIVFAAGYLFYNSSAVVSAQGSSSLEVKPDEVSIYLDIRAVNATAQGAQDQYNTINGNVLAALNILGFTQDELQLSSYNLYPEYDYKDNTRKLIGYTVNSQIIIKVKNFSQVPAIIDSSVNAEALVSSINFELSTAKQNEYKAKALNAASADSRTKAEAIASGLGKKLGGLVSVQSEEFRYPGPMLYYSASSMKGDAESARSAAVSLSPRDIEVSASVTAQYKLRSF